MNDSQRSQLLLALELQNEPIERQTATLQKIENLARRRLAGVLPDMLSDAQLEEVAGMQSRGVSQEEIAQWIVQHLPQPYDELLFAAMRGVVDDIKPKKH